MDKTYDLSGVIDLTHKKTGIRISWLIDLKSDMLNARS